MQITGMVSMGREFKTGGLAGWVLEVLRVLGRERVPTRPEMRVVESLSLGGRRQLLLVEYAGERYLVGGGADSIETIVHAAASRITSDSVTTAELP